MAAKDSDGKDSTNDRNEVSSETSNSNVNSCTKDSLPTCVVSPHTNIQVSNDNNNLRSIQLRREREFTPDSKKDHEYWDKRRRNNAAARKCREKRRIQDSVLENRIKELVRENCQLRNEMLALKRRFGVPDNEIVTLDDNYLSGTVYSRERRVETPPRRCTNNMRNVQYARYDRPQHAHGEGCPKTQRNSAGCQNQSDTLSYDNPSLHRNLSNQDEEGNLTSQSSHKEKEDLEYEYIF